MKKSQYRRPLEAAFNEVSLAPFYNVKEDNFKFSPWFILKSVVVAALDL